MQWTGLALVVVLGGATILAQSPHFMMVKPSIVYFAVAALMMRRGWMICYITPIARQNVSEATMVAAGYGWAALMAALGLTNLILALYFSFASWAWFVSMVRSAPKWPRARCNTRYSRGLRVADSPSPQPRMLAEA
jgi:intracellular septation protein